MPEKKRIEMQSFETVLPKLVKLPLFSAFDAEKEEDRRIMKLVYDNLSIEPFKAGEEIITEGEMGDELFILYEGEVLVTRKTPVGDVIALATLNSSMNIFFGEMAIISNDTRSATITANTDCLTLTIEGKKFLDVCDKEPVLGYRVLSVLAKRLANNVRDANKDKAILYEALCNEIENGV